MNRWRKGAGELLAKSPQIPIGSGYTKKYERNLRIRGGRKEGFGEEFRPPPPARFLKTAKQPVNNVGSNFTVAISKLFVDVIITHFGLYHNRIYNISVMPKSMYTKEYKEIIEKLKQARFEAGLRQEDVAEKLKKPQSYVSKIERGERRLDILEIKEFAKIYKKGLDFFIK